MDKQQQNRLRNLLDSYANGSIEPQALAELKSLLEVPGAEAVWEMFFIEEMQSNRYSKQTSTIDWDSIWEQVLAGREKRKALTPVTPVRKKGHHHLLSRRNLQVAAAILILLFCSTFFLTGIKDKGVTYQPVLATTKTIVHGRNGAVLHLTDGRAINLGEAKDGIIARQQGVQIIKTGTTLHYEGVTTQNLYNEITTDRGRQWNFTLPDGSLVWLNAASSIRFPLTFARSERLVDIQGEAYFEVKHNRAQPFKVRVGHQVIEDIGTAFNVNAYADEDGVRTTLISGSILLKFRQNSVLIKPGEQATVKDHISVKTVANPYGVIAWKNGMFQFYEADLPTIMRQLCRWYNVEVVYQKLPGDRRFTGKIPRTMAITEVLTILESAGAHFKVDGLVGDTTDGRIVVSP